MIPYTVARGRAADTVARTRDQWADRLRAKRTSTSEAELEKALSAWGFVVQRVKNNTQVWVQPDFPSIPPFTFHRPHKGVMKAGAVRQALELIDEVRSLDQGD